ncbi:collagen binding domain-containing protein [Paenibacillus glacialis]|uniref:Gram-positive cocci surface proteins LPxTG domain-containing protein n=1 Tax=Paenibacillus glacialis TaxID=494026 RepID=A0A168NMR6_9BACL|nr:collagen binding domain-containing protein [Paenibacillus glacialis]OAB45946.1 hypothetical protein PGLA_00685 [Paenibacillus glacialis]
MKERSKIMYLLLVISLVLNLVLPASMVIASDELEGSMNPTQESVIGETSEGNLGMSVTKSVYEITDNLITDVKMYDKKPLVNETDGSIITQGVEIQTIRPKVEDEVAIIFDWSLLSEIHQYDDGSTFTFSLPKEFNIPIELKGTLTGGVGDYVVSTTGKVTFIFNDAIKGQKLNGNFYVWLAFDQSELNDGLEYKIDFTSVGQSVIDVHFANTAKDGLTKTGKANKNNFNSDEIVWTVDFNQGEKEIKDAVLTDTLPSELTLKGNIEVRQLVVQIDGTVKEGTTVTTEPAFPVHLGDINKAYRVTYTTSVKAPSTAPFTNREFANEAVLTGNSGTINDTAIGKATVSFNEPLSKSGSNSAYDPITQTITWKVQYNYNQQTIPVTNAWIEDTFDTAKYKLVAGSVKVYQVDINSSGKGVNPTIIAASEYNLTGVGTGFDNGFKLKFNNQIDKAYEIEYQTKAINRVYEDTTVKNKVTMHDGTSKEGEKNINQVIFEKSVSKSDFQKKTIEWKIVLNQDLNTMTDIVITDNYVGKHMKLDPNSIKINGQAIQNSTKFELKAADLNDLAYEKGFTLELKAGESIDSKYVITYTTSFDPTVGMPTNNKYENKATLSWKEPGITPDPTPITEYDYVTPESYTLENGNKKGDYNAKDKTITWMIDVNYNLFDIQDAVIKDNYTGDQTFVENSLKVSKLTLDPVNNKVTDVGGEVTLTEGQFQLNADGKGFVLDLNTIGKNAYRITYKTSLDGNYPVKGTYSNNATMHDGENGPQRFTKSISVTPKNGGEYINKTGKQKFLGSDIASWTVNINRSQSYVAAGSILTDTLSDKQILLKDSLKLYKTDISPNNSGTINKTNVKVDKNDYDLVVTGNTFIITFKKALNTAYILEYESYINTDTGQRIENKVEFAGQSSTVKGSDSKEGVIVSLAGAGGGASTGIGKIKIVKIDDLNQPIAGVVFELYNASGTTLLEKLTTDVNGEVSTTRNYKYNNTNAGLPYMLKEVSVPSGYLIDPEFGAPKGKEIKFKDVSNTFTIINETIRQGFELTKVDATDSTKKLKGAVFELKLNGTLIDTLTTNSLGRIAKGDLPSGDYELVEIAAPDFYVVDAKPIAVKIVANQTKVLELDHKNAQGTDGKLVITKVNAKDQSVIQGVEFELRDHADVVVAAKTTDINGVIEFTNLPYGPYTVVETKADGYVIEVANREVLITKAETTLTIENKENDRSVKLTKYNSIRSQKIQGAVFELREETKIFDKDGNFVYKVVPGIDEAKLTTDVNGELLLESLVSNKYQLIEIKAPFGYLLDKTPVAFEITDKQTETVLVEKTNNRISTPVDPSGPTGPGNPGIPVDPTPIIPVDPTPITPVDPKPGEPVDPTPGTPIDPKPVKPVIPDEKVVTTKETPVKGKVEVPKDTTPKISKQPKNGKVTVDPKGNWVYKPKKDYVGKDSFTIIVTDKDGNEEEVLVEVDVNDIPRGGTDGISENTGKTHSQNTLPQTGESSHLPLQLTGFGFIILGALLLFFRKKQLQRK